jgi:hypothetical protein
MVRQWNRGDECLAQRARTSTTTWGQLQQMTPTPSWPDLANYELAQSDRDRYTILAVDLTVDGPVTATVYAIDRIEHGIAVNRATELGRSRGEVPVVPFDLPEPGVEEFIRHAFKTISVRFVPQPLRDQVLVAEPASARHLEPRDSERP